jgi:hypothetical protein
MLIRNWLSLVSCQLQLQISVWYRAFVFIGAESKQATLKHMEGTHGAGFERHHESQEFSNQFRGGCGISSLSGNFAVRPKRRGNDCERHARFSINGSTESGDEYRAKQAETRSTKARTGEGICDGGAR